MIRRSSRDHRLPWRDTPWRHGHGTVHLNEDLLVIEREVIDAASGRFVPIVTDLWRTSQAVIRYRMGDVLVPRRGPCPCGSVLAGVERIEGREDDVLTLPEARGESLLPVFADAVRAAGGVPQAASRPASSSSATIRTGVCRISSFPHRLAGRGARRQGQESPPRRPAPVRWASTARAVASSGSLSLTAIRSRCRAEASSPDRTVCS